MDLGWDEVTFFSENVGGRFDIVPEIVREQAA